VYAAFTSYDHFLWWQRDCDASARCAPGSETAEYLAELDATRPLFHGGSGSFAQWPFFWGLGAVRGGRATQPTSCRESDGTCACEPLVVDHGPDVDVYGARLRAHDVFGSGTADPVRATLAAGFATPSEVTRRITELQAFLPLVSAHGHYFPYGDLASQLYGNHLSSTSTSSDASRGAWYFHASLAPEFERAGFDLGGKHDPSTWLKHWWDPGASNKLGAPDALRGLAFDYHPVQCGWAGPASYRYAANPLSADYRSWREHELAYAAKAGYSRIFLDNVVWGACYDASCEDAYRASIVRSMGESDAERLFARPGPTMLPYGDFEQWLRDPDPPYSWSVAGLPIPSVQLQGGATLSPDTRSHRGLYAGRLVGPSGEDDPVWGKGHGHDALVFATVPVTPGRYRLRFAVRGVGDARLSVRASFDAELARSDLTPSDAWSTSELLVSIGHERGITVAFNADGAVLLDDVELVRDDDPSFHAVPRCDGRAASAPGWLPRGEESIVGCGAARRAALRGYGEGVLDETLVALRTGVRRLSCRDDFDFVVNSSGRQHRGAEAFVAEGTTDEAGRTDAARARGWGRPPGVYVGDRGERLLVSNLFTYRHMADMRLRDEFAWGYHLPAAIPRGQEQNPDSVLLALAEGAAFGGGVAVDPLLFAQYDLYAPQPGDAPSSRRSPYGAYRDALTSEVARFFGFVRDHRDLYDCLASSADVALVFRSEPLVRAQRRDDALTTMLLADRLAADGATVDVLGDREISEADLDGRRVLVLSHVERLSEAETSLVTAFVARGGLVVTTSDSGSLDALGRYRDALPATSWKLTPSESPEGRLWTLPEGRDVTAEDVRRLLAHAGVEIDVFPGAPRGEGGRTLRASAWSAWDRFVVHVLDYDVEHGRHRGRVRVTRDLRVAVRPPSGRPPPTHARLFSPELECPAASADACDGPCCVPVRALGDGRVEIEIPELRIYTAVSFE
jgi:hypothetical protein